MTLIQIRERTAAVCLLVCMIQHSALTFTTTPLRPFRHASHVTNSRRLRSKHVDCGQLVSSRRNCSAGDSASNMRDELGLHDRFDRWRWLQQLLDGETDPFDTNRVLFQVLDLYLKSPPKDTEGFPELTSARRSSLELVIDGAHDGLVQALAPSDDSAATLSSAMYIHLEELLPDADEEEDAFKSLWDIVMELNGRESVKINEREARSEWKLRCLVARVLLYYDFLSRGIP